MEALEKNPEKVVSDFEEIRKLIFNPQNMRVAVAGDILGLEKPRGEWEKAIETLNWKKDGYKETLDVTWGRDVLSALGKNPKKKVSSCSLFEQKRVSPNFDPSSAFFKSGCHHSSSNH